MTDETRDDDKLATAEEDAAREAAAAIADERGEGGKVRRPRARTAGKAASNGSDGAVPAATRPGTTAATPVVEDAVGADSLTLVRSSVAEANARTVDVRQGAIGRLEAEEVFVSQGAIGAARGDRVGVELGALGAGLAGELRITQGAAGTVVARSATVEQSFVRTMIAGEVHAARPVGVFVLLAGRVNGDVRPVLDWRGALAFGAVAGLLIGLLRRARRSK
ncbi:MAG TPA: hypothetical protein VFK54_00725 [Candidatus Limnocylindrales bacterium]|nr:hypothetical protein [Candidatus Limnocylindrales bacterium]